MTDPVAAIEGVYAAIGRRFDQDHAHRITDYLAAKPRGKHGTHTYTAAEWGFDADALRTELAEYVETFAIPLEAE